MSERNQNTIPVVGLVLTLIVLLMGGFFLFWLVALHTETVEPGEHGVIIDKPYVFGHEGVRDEVLKEGRIMLFRTSALKSVRMTPQSVAVKFDDLSSADNILLDFESTIQYQVTDAKTIVRDFGDTWFTSNIEQPYRAIVRDVAKRFTMSQMMPDTNTAAEVDRQLTEQLQKLVVETKVPLRIVGVSLGRAKPNANVLEQMNQTAAQQQRKKTLVEAEAAEIQREKEQIAKAKADNAYRNSIGLSPEQFVQLEQIKRYSDACLKAGNVCVIDASGRGHGVNVNTK